MHLRVAALIPFIFILAALILSFLCLFAGSERGFLDTYDIISLNTSRFGYTVFNTSEATDTDNPVRNLFNKFSNNVEGDIQDEPGDVAKKLGLHDFYSAHVLNYCEGYYTPSPVPNNTLSKSDIDRNVTFCSNRTAMYHFDPRDSLQRELNESGSGISLADLNWPQDIDDGLKALKVVSQGIFVLYCISIGLMIVALVLCALGICIGSGRLSALIEVAVDSLAFLAIGLTSAFVTAVSVKGAHLINKYGNDIGIAADIGKKFLALTWVATACMLVAVVVWCIQCFVGRNKDYRNEKS